MQILNISYELTIDDWMAFQQHYLSTSKQFNQTKQFVAWIIPAIFLISSLYEIFLGNSNYYSIAVFMGISIVWLLLYPKIFEKRVLTTIKKILEEGDNSSILGVHNLVFNEDSLIVNEPNSEQIIKWSAIKRVEETEDYIFVYLNSISACIIPKFKIEDNKNQVKNLLKLKLRV